MITSVEDVDAKIQHLKAPPCALNKEDFFQEYGVLHEENNLHHFRKSTVSPKTLKKLFG